ncbi:MAG: helix-turn-helix domain-containing protein [Lachnospiraceae bacterium]|nr:helix-turn-helix domain-containing protein [Lachnospiraceae bacterium]
MNKKLFSERLLTLRRNKNIAQQKLAEILNEKNDTVVYTQPLLSSFESAESLRHPTVEQLIHLANYFNKPIDYLLGRDSTFNAEEATFTDVYKLLTQADNLIKEGIHALGYSGYADFNRPATILIPAKWHGHHINDNMLKDRLELIKKYVNDSVKHTYLRDWIPEVEKYLERRKRIKEQAFHEKEMQPSPPT